MNKILFRIGKLPVAEHVKGGIELPVLDSQEHAGSEPCREP